MSSSSKRPIGFLDMPLEIRRQIYQYCLVREHPVNVDVILFQIFVDNPNSPERFLPDEKNSLLLVSKKIGSGLMSNTLPANCGIHVLSK